jgi:hypothetical protein
MMTILLKIIQFLYATTTRPIIQKPKYFVVWSFVSLRYKIKSKLSNAWKELSNKKFEVNKSEETLLTYK